MVSILVVEDDKELNNVQCRHLSMDGYLAKGCENMTDALNQMYEEHFDIIMTDVMMPGGDGFELAQVIREQDKEIPILFVTARDDFSSKERGYRIGIDDYMVKPIDLGELTLRIGALVRRAKIADSGTLTVGNLCLDEKAFTAAVNGEPVELSVREFRILYKLLSYPCRAFTRSQLMDEFWGLESETGLRSVDVYIASLRSKLADCEGFAIRTVYGMGYKAEVKNGQQ